MMLLTRANSTPAYLYAFGVQNAMQDSIVMPVTSVNDATLSVRLLVESLVPIQKRGKTWAHSDVRPVAPQRCPSSGERRRGLASIQN